MTLPSLHDSNLIGMHWRADRLSLDFDDDGREILVEMTGVQALRIEGLREGNIVSEALLFDRGNSLANERDVTKWLEYLVAGSEVASSKAVEDANRKSVSKLLALLADGKAQCFCLTPVYGGAIACIHHDLRCIERPSSRQ